MIVDVLPTVLASGGLIVRRQSTFWDVAQEAGATHWRLHFLTKREFAFVATECDSIEFFEHHPLLEEYRQEQASLMVYSKVAEHEVLLGRLRQMTLGHFDGWRTLDRYLNPGCPAERILADGFGLLLRGPESLVRAAGEVLLSERVACRVELSSAPPRASTILLFGRSYVIAEAFKFEQLAHNAG